MVQTEVPIAASLKTPEANRRRKWAWVFATAIFALILYNATVAWPVHAALADEDEYSVVAYRRWLISPNSIVFDVRSVEPTASMAGVDRSLFKAAEALKDRTYGEVVLAHRGNDKFLLDGSAFKTIGEQRRLQNPVYVIRTMQKDIKHMDGTPAFPSISGGWLGVLGEEIRQHNELHEKWWVRDEAGSFTAE